MHVFVCVCVGGGGICSFVGGGGGGVRACELSVCACVC